MTRKASSAGLTLLPVSDDEFSSSAKGHDAAARARAAGEIAQVVLVLRNRAVEFDLKFVAYLLEMAFTEAFELSQKHAVGGSD
jgi:hypothetical protein